MILSPLHKLWFLFKNNPRIILGVILLLGILLRLHNFNESLWRDEAWYSTQAALKDTNQLLRDTFEDKTPPFYRVFMFCWIRLFGDSEVSVRIPPFLAGILSIFLTYLIALRSLGPNAALLPTFLLCISAVHIWYSREAVFYSLLLFLILAALYSLYKLRERGKGAVWYFIYFLSLFLAVFTHWFAVIYLILTSITSLSFKPKTVKRNILGLNVAILIFAVAFIVLKARIYPLLLGDYFLRPLTFFELWMLFFNWFLFGNSLWTINPYNHHLSVILHHPGLLAAQIFFFFIFSKGLWSAYKDKKPGAPDNVLYLFMLPLVILGLSYAGFRRLYIERYLLPALPFFYIILSGGALSLKNKYLKIIAVASLVFFSLAALIGFLVSCEDWTVYKRNPDWRSLVFYLAGEQKEIKEPKAIFMVIPLDTIRYYLNKVAVSKKTPVRFWLYYNAKKPLQEIVEENKISTFYLIEETVWKRNFDKLLATVMGNPKFHLIETRPFKRLRIFKFSVKR